MFAWQYWFLLFCFCWNFSLNFFEYIAEIENILGLQLLHVSWDRLLFNGVEIHSDMLKSGEAKCNIDFCFTEYCSIIRSGQAQCSFLPHIEGLFSVCDESKTGQYLLSLEKKLYKTLAPIRYTRHCHCTRDLRQMQCLRHTHSNHDVTARPYKRHGWSRRVCTDYRNNLLLGSRSGVPSTFSARYLCDSRALGALCSIWRKSTNLSIITTRSNFETLTMHG